MRVLLSVEERKEAYGLFVKSRIQLDDDEELKVLMPSYSEDQARVDIVKKPPQEQPQE